MGLCSLVTRRNGIYSFRKRVPHELQGILGKKIIKRSLRTSKPNDAKKMKAQIEAEIMELFAAKRAEIAGVAHIPSAAVTAEFITPLNSLQSNASAKGNNLTIQDIFNKWAENKRRSAKNKGSADVSIGRNQQKLEAFIKSQGNLLIGNVNVDHIIAFREQLQKATEHKGKTINNYLKSIAATVGFAANERYIDKHPLKGIKYLLSQNNSEKWIPFEKEDLEKLFLNSDYKNLRKQEPNNFWIPLIQLFTGARIEEVSQLKRKDIKQDDGIYYFDINEDDPDKNLKTKSSIRKVPVHPELLKMGVIEYINSQTNPEAFIFPNLIICENRRSHKVSKWFGKYKRNVGITHKSKVNHSFRGTFIDACRLPDFDADIRRQLTGHSSNNVGDKYGYGYPVKSLYPVLCKVNYGVDFSSLYIPTHTQIQFPISTPIPFVSPAKASQAPHFKELKDAVRLAEAYQQMGKAHFGNEWIDYQICLYNERKWFKTNVANMLANTHKGKGEIRVFTSVDKLEFEPASDSEAVKHLQIVGYLEKLFKEVVSYGKKVGTSDYEILSEEDFYDSKLLGNQLLLSRYELMESNGKYATYDILLNRDGLEKAIRDYF